jgi:hypothetical protein
MDTRTTRPTATTARKMLALVLVATLLCSPAAQRLTRHQARPGATTTEGS